MLWAVWFLLMSWGIKHIFYPNKGFSGKPYCWAYFITANSTLKNVFMIPSVFLNWKCKNLLTIKKKHSLGQFWYVPKTSHFQVSLSVGHFYCLQRTKGSSSNSELVIRLQLLCIVCVFFQPIQKTYNYLLPLANELTNNLTFLYFKKKFTTCSLWTPEGKTAYDIVDIL